MAGLNRDTPIPVEIKLHQQSRMMEIAFSDGAHFRLPYELLRVYSPSAAVRGHGPGQETLQTGKRNVGILGVEQVGNYAIQPVFSDGHDSGIYSWDLLYDLGARQEVLWQNYLARLEGAGLSRDSDPDTETVKAAPNLQHSRARSCGRH